MLAYKLTDTDYKTRAGHFNCLLWGENVTHAVNGSAQKLCSDSWIHFYTHPFIASLMNCKHANIIDPVLWECVVDGEITHESLKSGCKQLTTVKIIPMPEYSTVSKIAFAILITKQFYKCPKWNKWADNWLNGTDRSKEAAYAAADAADAYAAAYAAYAADAAAAAAAYAAYAANAAYAAYAANADYAAYAANAADVYAACAADAYAADAYATNTKLDIPLLINQALQIK